MWALDALCRLLACPWLPFCVSCSELGRCPPEAFREFWGQAGVSQQSPGWSKFIMTAHLTRSVHGGSSHSPSPRTSWSSVPGTPSSLPRTPRGPLSPQQQALSQPSPPTRCDTVSGKGSPPGSESSPFAAVPRAGRGALSRDEVRDASTVRPCIHRGQVHWGSSGGQLAEGLHLPITPAARCVLGAGRGRAGGGCQGDGRA